MQRKFNRINHVEFNVWHKICAKVTAALGHVFSASNARIYNLSSVPHMTHFSAVVSKKRKSFE